MIQLLALPVDIYRFFLEELRSAFLGLEGLLPSFVKNLVKIFVFEQTLLNMHVGLLNPLSVLLGLFFGI